MVVFLAYSLEKKAEKLTEFSIGFLPHVLVFGAFAVFHFQTAGFRVRTHPGCAHMADDVCRRRALPPSFHLADSLVAGGLLLSNQRRVPGKKDFEFSRPLAISGEMKATRLSIL